VISQSSSCTCARAHIITEFEGAGPSFKSFSEDVLKSHIRDMWELMYHKTRQHEPIGAAALVTRIVRHVPVSHIQQLLMDDTFVFSVSNINQVLERCGNTGADGDELSFESKNEDGHDDGNEGGIEEEDEDEDDDGDEDDDDGDEDDEDDVDDEDDEDDVDDEDDHDGDEDDDEDDEADEDGDDDDDEDGDDDSNDDDVDADDLGWTF
jgi:hypothetical protein